MPQPLPSRPEDKTPAAGSESRHYFDRVHGDVGSLHARIEQELRSRAFTAMPHSHTADRLENAVQAVSRGAGVVGLLGALALIAYALI